MRNKSIQCLFIAILFALNGCVSSTQTLNPKKKVKEGYGVIVMALVNDKSLVNAMTGEITYKKIGSKEYHYLSAENDYNPFDNDFKYIKNVRGRILALELPAGKYALTNWAMANYATNSYVIPKNIEPINFTVKPNTITYLGHFFYKTKFEGKDLFNRPAASGGEVIISNQSNIDIAIAKLKYPNIRNFSVSTQVNQITSWKQNYLND